MPMPQVPTTRFYQPCSGAMHFAVQRRYPRYNSFHGHTSPQPTRPKGRKARLSQAVRLLYHHHPIPAHHTNRAVYPMTLNLVKKEHRIPHSALRIPHSQGRPRWRRSWEASLCVNAPICNCTGDTSLSCVLQVRPQIAARAGGLR
jgi:hypothetical protein